MAEERDFLLTSPLWDVEGRRSEDDCLSAFVVFWTDLAKLKSPSMEQALSAIVWVHQVAGVSSPTVDRPRLALIRKAIKRRDGGTQNRKAPVVPRVAGQAIAAVTREAYTFPSGSKERRQRLAQAASVAVGFNFLLGRSEFLPSEKSKGQGRGLRVSDLELIPALGEAPARLRLKVRGSKTDVLNLGCKRERVMYPSGSINEDICPVRAVARWAQELPPGTDPESFAFSGVTADGLQKLLRQSDSLVREACGMGSRPKTEAGGDSISLHSLRAGGASALWAAGLSPASVMREGRWLSDCFHRYLTTSEGDRDSASWALASTEVSVEAAYRDM